MINRKTQIEITNIMFMHLIGLIGILTFTFLFVSLIAGSSVRAEGLRDETLYYAYGRRLISSSDCLAYNQIIPYYDGTSFSSVSRIKPGIIDVSKLLNYNNQNCLRYDLVSGSFTGDPNNPVATYPVVMYEVTVEDLKTGQVYNFTNDVYQSVSAGVEYEICNPINCLSNCLYDCDELRAYKYSVLTDITGTTLECPSSYIRNLAETTTGSTGFEGVVTEVVAMDIELIPGTNCWSAEFNDISRIVAPYTEPFNCSIFDVYLTNTTSEAGTVSQTELQYAVQLRYPGEADSFIQNPGILNVKFCVVKIPSMCDPFYGNTFFGFFNVDVYRPEDCQELGLPLI